MPLHIPTLAEHRVLYAKHQGIISEPFPRGAAVAAHTLISGNIYAAACPVRRGDIITGVAVICTTAATAGATVGKVGIYSALAAPARLAISANVPTFLDVVGAIKTPFTAPYEVLADGVLYASLIMVNAVATAAIARGGSTDSTAAFGAGGTNGAGLRPWWLQSAQTDLIATATPAGANNSDWIALY